MTTIPRVIEVQLLSWLGAPEILTIRGPRQSGKTTLLYRLRNVLTQQGIPPARIHFITFEDDIERKKFEQNPVAYIQYYLPAGQERSSQERLDQERHVFLLDEVQYIERAGKHLKLIYDSFPEIKIIMTGSSSLDLREVASSLAGRALFFELYPFSFEEFLGVKDKRAYEYYRQQRFVLGKETVPSALFVDNLNLILQEYLTYGGYPRVVLESDPKKKKFLLRNLYLTYLEKDILKIYGLKYQQKVADLLHALSGWNASQVNYNELGSLTNLYFQEVKEVLRILEDTYIIQLVRPFHKNLITEIRKNPKLYFMDLGLRNSIANRFEFSEEEAGKLLETFVLGQFRGKEMKYWRTTAKAEVDFIHPEQNMPVEVKRQPKISRSLRSFITAYQPATVLLITSARCAQEKVNGSTVFIIPASLL